MKVDVLALGNVLIDVLLKLPDSTEFCRLDETTNEFSIKAGEKVHAEKATFAVGGGACRVALGLKKLGLTTSLIAEVGNDNYGETILKALQKEGVDTSHIVQTDTDTSFSFGLNYKEDRTLFIHLVNRKHEFSFSDLSASWLYVASLGDEWQKAYSDIAEYIATSGVKLAFNPGQIQLAAGRSSYQRLLDSADVLFVNKQEAMRMAGTDDTSLSSLLKTVQSFGPKYVVITDGQKGSYAIDQEGACYQMAIYEEPVVERTGAGDAYATGFVAALYAGKSVAEAMQWGTVNAASVVGKLGGEAGQLYKEHLTSMLTSSKLPEVRRMDV